MLVSIPPPSSPRQINRKQGRIERTKKLKDGNRRAMRRYYRKERSPQGTEKR